MKVGILGAANIAKKICRAISMVDGVEVAAVGSREEPKSEAFLASCGLAGKAVAYGSYQEVLDDPAVDAVYIPLPTALHVEWVTKAAAKDKHIMLEKPIALTSQDTDAVVQACKSAGVQLMDGTMWTHSPRTARMEEALRERERMGEVKEVNTLFTFMGSEDFFRSDVRVKPDCDALGALGDLGWYCIRAILWAFDYDEPATVVAHGGPIFNEAGVPIHIGATILFSGGRRGNFECGFDRALTQYLEVAGTQGTIRLDDFVIPRDELRCSFVATREHGLRDMDTWDGTKQDAVTVFLDKPQEVSQWLVFQKCVQQIKAGGAPDDRWPRIAALTQKVCCAVLESARQGGKEVNLCSEE